MAKPQQPELHRSGLTPADPASAKSSISAPPPGGQESIGPVPDDNTPGHHPEQEQDKPVDAFVARARERTRRTRAAEAAESEVAARHTAGSDRTADLPGPASGWGPGSDTHDIPRPGPLAGVPGIPIEVVIPGLALLDASRRPQSEWDEIGESRGVWMTRIVLFAWLGAWRYATEVKPRLEAARRARDLAGG